MEAKTYYVCSKCHRVAEISDTKGWLIAQRKNAAQGHMIIRCAACATNYARRIAK